MTGGGMFLLGIAGILAFAVISRVIMDRKEKKNKQIE
jgi:hypothetical protein